MGVDAEMLVRGVKETTVTDEWLKEMSWRLCQSVGAKHFKVGEYWRGFTDWTYNAIMRSGRWAGDDENIKPGSKYIQDGKDIDAEPGECMLELGLLGRYYGIGYERGDILAYCAIAEWLEYNIPGCTVYYGGDSSGVCAEQFDEKARIRLRQHLLGTDGRAYFNYSRMPRMPGEAKVQPPACSACPGGKYAGSQFGWGGPYAAFSCPGCGDKTCTRDNGKTWEKDKSDD